MIAHALGRMVAMIGLTGTAFVAVASCGTSGDGATQGDASTFDGSGGPTFNGDGGGSGMSCSASKTCASAGYTCGVNADGCGNTINCGTCTGGDVCGVGGFSKCGDPTIALDGGRTCVRETCADLGFDCGQAGDGCGGVIGPCGACSSPHFCGGGGPNKCGGDSTVTADGGAVATCTPATCASLGYNCGSAGDGCGATIGPCGTCAAPLSCGAGGRANVCGLSVPCTGLCLQQAACSGGATTTISGTVRSGLQESTVTGNPVSWVPAGTTPDPVPNVTVYVPQSGLDPFDADPSHPKVQCSQCGADVSGNPLVTTTTAFDGTFTLKNVPVSHNGTDKIPVVIQLGRWRRQFSFVVSNSCADNPVGTLNLPSKSSEGDIPLTAISTGSYDSIECVLLKMGVAQNEFTSYPTWNAQAASGASPKPGRVHIYTSTAAGDAVGRGPGSVLAPQQDETVLLGANTTAGPANGTFMSYDQILLPCWGDEFGDAKNAAEKANLGYYGDHGGHFFATHYSYAWLNTNTNSNLSSVANWDVKANQNIANTVFTGNVSSAVPTANPGVFLRWLNGVGALNNSNPGGNPPANPTVSIAQGRHDVDSVKSGSADWIDGTDPAPRSGVTSQMLLHFTFDMPVGQASQCGHAIYSDFHVNGTQSIGTTFPSECDKTALTSQERVLEYMIWDLASCVPGPPVSTCVPKSCAAQGVACGPAGDTCGNLIQGGCGSCPTGQTCGGGGISGVCGGSPPIGCVPRSCTDQAIACGPAGDGCGNLIAGGCGNCTPPQVCGGGGAPAVCGGSTGCTPETCQAQGISCGPAGDGCGAVIPSCGVCTLPETCGGGGMPGVCGAGMSR